jgi:hypothetical protein
MTTPPRTLSAALLHNAIVAALTLATVYAAAAVFVWATSPELRRGGAAMSTEMLAADDPNTYEFVRVPSVYEFVHAHLRGRGGS